MMHIDLDEFMHARSTTLADYLHQCQENVAFLSVPWKMYGSSGITFQKF